MTLSEHIRTARCTLEAVLDAGVGMPSMLWAERQRRALLVTERGQSFATNETELGHPVDAPWTGPEKVEHTAVMRVYGAGSMQEWCDQYTRQT